MISEKLKKGHLLIAEPSIIGDISFNRSVILLADHNKNGSVGFIINKPLKYTINDLIPEIRASFKIYNGGPVEQDNLYFIHNIPDLIPNSIEISNGIYWGGEYETTKKLINNGKITKNNIRFFLGYTGWEEDQLETEMEEDNEDKRAVNTCAREDRALGIPSLGTRWLSERTRSRSLA